MKPPREIHADLADTWIATTSPSSIYAEAVFHRRFKVLRNSEGQSAAPNFPAGLARLVVPATYFVPRAMMGMSRCVMPTSIAVM